MFLTTLCVPMAPRPVRMALLAGCLWVSGMVMSPALASGKEDHDRAWQAVEAGQVLPLPAVLERLQRDVPGHVLDVELELERGTWIYEIKLLTFAGQLTKVKLDARTAEVLRVQQREDGSPSSEGRPNRRRH